MTFAEKYMQATAEELTVPNPLNICASVKHAVMLTRYVRHPDVRQWAASAFDLFPPETALGHLLQRLIQVDAQFEQHDTGLFLCDMAEWNFFNAVENPELHDGRSDDYSQTTIYTHDKNPILITKGDPHGKRSTIVCGEIPGDNRFILGTMGVLYNRFDNSPDFKKNEPGIIQRDIDEGLKLKVTRPSTLVAFPLEARLKLSNNPSDLDDVYATAHKTKTIDDLAKLAASITSEA